MCNRYTGGNNNEGQISGNQRRQEESSDLTYAFHQ